MKMTGSRPGVHSQKSRRTSGSLQNMAGFDGISSGLGCGIHPSLGQFLKICGRYCINNRICIVYIYVYVWHCPCLGCPKQRKLPQMGQLAAHLGQDLGCPNYLMPRSCTLMPRFAHWHLGRARATLCSMG